MGKIKRRADGEGEAAPEVFSGDRRKLTAEFVARFETLLQEQQDTAEDLKELAGEAKRKQFTKAVVKAMRKIAKLRLDDKRREASAQLEALQQVADACNFDLFEWQKAGAASPGGANSMAGRAAPAVTH